MSQAARSIVYKRLRQRDVDDFCERHHLLTIGRLGGARANFSYTDISGLDLSGRTLNDADFTGASLAGAGQRPTTVSGDATERLESLSPGDSRAMLVLATGENTTAGAKTVIFTPDVDGQQAIAAAIEVFGS